jgi:hypothetical protein
MMDMKPGSRWKAHTAGPEFVVVRPPKQQGEVRCGGHQLVPVGASGVSALAPEEGLADPVMVGKRYFDETSELELLASKAGTGTLTIDGRVMAPKAAKALPASD